MSVKEVSLKSLAAVIAKDSKARETRVVRAARRAAKQGVGVIKKNIPVAFGELRESAHEEDTERGGQVIVDAPHAEAVENGSRPHWMPIAPILAWVKLRGMQALIESKMDKNGRLRTLKGQFESRLSGTTTVAQAQRVGAHLRALSEAAGGTSSPVDAAMQVARAIQAAIAKHGTKPHAFARTSVPQIEALLDGLVKDALQD